mmetsp:Transcript_17220/g.41357  ORF Transcript_17220/g.41357 Transcript_17220/m.41357 type:complete len:123 (-) Transcript_17220:248-616(-)
MQLQQEKGLLATKQTVIHQSTKMEDNRTLAHYNVQEDATLHLDLPVHTSGCCGFGPSTGVSAEELSMLTEMDGSNAALVEAWHGKEHVLQLVGEVTEAFNEPPYSQPPAHQAPQDLTTRDTM